MSVDSAKKFLERIIKDEAFRDKAALCKDKEEKFAFVKAEGFDFTPNELLSLKPKEGELSESDLESVAGGRGRGYSLKNNVCSFLAAWSFGLIPAGIKNFK